MVIAFRLLSSGWRILAFPRNHPVSGGAALGCVLIAALVALTFAPFDSRAAGTFNPVNTATYSTTDPGSHPDVSSTFALGLGPDVQPYTADDTNDYAPQRFLGLSLDAPGSRYSGRRHPRDGHINPDPRYLEQSL